MKTFFNAISGKKTVSGAVILVSLFLARKFGIDFDQATEHVTKIIEWIGAGIAIFGLLHKLLKRTK